jgi:hypothetical protein
MATQMYLGFDDTIPENGLSALGGTSGVTGRSGRGLACRRQTTALAHLAILQTPLSTLWCGMGYFIGAVPNAQRNISFVAPDGTTIHCGIGRDSSDHVTIYGPAGTVVATSAGTFSNAVWRYLEANVVIHDTTGLVEVRIGETVVVSYSGDTRNGTATTVGFIDAVGGTSSAAVDYDDLYIDDAGYLGDITVEALSPTGNGSSSDWVGSDGNSTDNYLLVDDPTTSNMTDYVGASVSGKLDLYTMGDLPAGYSVLAIQEIIYAQKSDAGTAPTLLPVAKGQAGTTRTDTAVPALSTTPLAYVSQMRTTDPDGNALTAARVNAMEVGVKIS